MQRPCRPAPGTKNFPARSLITSLLQSDILREGRAVGHVSFEERGHSRLWTQQETDALILMSRIIGECIRQRRASALLRENAGATRAILDSLTRTAVYVIDHARRLLYFNGTVSRLLPHVRVGMTCHEVFWGHRDACSFCPLHNAGESDAFSVILPHTPFAAPSDVSVSRILWESREPAWVVLISEHILTREEEAEKKSAKSSPTPSVKAIPASSTSTLKAAFTKPSPCAKAPPSPSRPPEATKASLPAFRSASPRLSATASAAASRWRRCAATTGPGRSARWTSSLRPATSAARNGATSPPSRGAPATARGMSSSASATSTSRPAASWPTGRRRKTSASPSRAATPTSAASTSTPEASPASTAIPTSCAPPSLSDASRKTTAAWSRRASTPRTPSPSAASSTPPSCAAASAPGEQPSVEYRKRGEDGAWHWLLALVVALPSAPSQALLLVRDITENKAREANYLLAIQSNYSEIFLIDIPKGGIAPLYTTVRPAPAPADFGAFADDAARHVDPDFTEAVRAFYNLPSLAERLARGENIELEYRKRHGEGAPYRWTSAAVRPIPGNEGHAMLLLRDVTDLRDEENNFYRVLRSSYTEIYEVALDSDALRLIYREDNALERPPLGRRYSEGIRALVEAVHPDDRETYLRHYDPDAIRRGIAQGLRLNLEYRTLGKDGTYRSGFLLLLLLPGASTRFLILCQDISERNAWRPPPCASSAARAPSSASPPLDHRNRPHHMALFAHHQPALARGRAAPGRLPRPF
ncbi:MAG: hypothetical protein V8Q84_05275 [Bilophila sp.]